VKEDGEVKEEEETAERRRRGRDVSQSHLYIPGCILNPKQHKP